MFPPSAGEASQQCHLPVTSQAGEELFTRACSRRTMDNGFKIEEGRFRFDIRKKFLL